MTDSLRRPVGALRWAVRLVVDGRWGEIAWRIRLRVHRIDLRQVSVTDLGLSTEGSIGYVNSGGPELDAVLAALKIPHGAHIVDLGCGKGGALIVMARHPFGRVTGVDLSAELLEIARRNVEKMKLTGVDFACENATEVNLDDYEYIYLYNPFPCAVMDLVMGNLVQSLRRVPRPVTIIYNTAQCHESVVATGCFEKVRDYPSSPRQPPFSLYVSTSP